ncbi:translocation/assembly module TamB domain-containing protein [Pseudovibrio sp. Ad37]|uniref:translocation/assembly module TamB domain-containing protein n=1 Tax=Pseudovibrio sp. Ad37 TaxID=989422 RepID=UPI0007AE70D2|nr:translocation/assembly module TamB domain-containing protein [Pseudovibrio sp. Ad37]KZL24837.1 Translocation and assembly module TamB [Pseudovibrio sp. Ad37]
MQLVRRITMTLGKILALLLVLVLVVYAGLVVTTSFQAGRQFLGSTLSSFLPDVRIDQPRLTASGNLFADGVYLSDAKGTWLEVHRASVRWSPLSLLFGALDIHEGAAQRIALARLPEATESPGSEPAPAEETGITLPFNTIDLQSLNIKELALPASIAGMPAQFEITGTATYASSPDKIAGKLNISRTGDVQGTASIDVDFDPADGVVNFRGMVSEAANGLTANLLDLPDAPSFALRMEGGGPLTNWSSSLQVDLNRVRAIDGEITLAQNGTQKSLTTHLSGELEQFLPSSISSLFAGQTTWFANATLNEDYLPLSVTGKLSTGAILAHLENTYATDKNSLIAKVQIQTLESNTKPLLIKTGEQAVQLDTLSVTASASGPLESLNWDFSVQADKIKTQEADLGALSLSAKGDGANISAQIMSIPLEARLQVSGVHLAPASQDQNIKNISVSLKGIAFPNQEKLKLSELHLESDAAAARFNLVELSPSNGQAQGNLSVSDLSLLSGFVQQNVSGSVEAQLSLLADFQKQSGEINLKGTSSRVSMQNERIDRILTSPGRFSAKLAATLDSTDLLASYGRLEVLSFENMFGQFEAHGSLQDRQLDGAFSAQVHQLDLLEPRVSGALTASGKVSGNTSAPEVTLEIHSDRIEMDGTPLEKLKLVADGTLSETAPNSDINLTGRFKGEELVGKFKLLSEAGKLSVPILDFDFGGNKLSGNAHATDLALLPQGLVGQFTIEANDLSTLSSLALTEMEGQAHGQIDIEQDNGDAKISFDLSSQNLRFAQSSIMSFVAKGWIDKPFTRPAANANIALDGVEVEGVNLRSLTLNATPVEGKTSAEVATGFSINAEFAENNDQLQSAGLVQAVPEGIILTLNSLNGRYKGIQTNLKQPAVISLLEDKRTVSSFELALGSGSLNVYGSNSNQLNINAELKQLPLSIANAFVPSLALDGALNGTVRAFGENDAPQVSWRLALSQFSAKPLQDNRILPLQIESTGSFADNKIDQKTIVTNSSGLNVEASGAIGLADGQEVSLTTSGNIPLDVVGAKLIEQNLGGSGGFRLSGSVSGSLKDPQIAIDIQPVNLETTQLSTGMTLTDYSGDIKVTRQEIAINKFAAKFSNGGTLVLDGKLGLGSGLPAQMELTIDGGRYVDGTFVSALIDANLALQGSLADAGAPPAISGKVTINQADIEIPSSFNSSINPVIVRHLNAPKPILNQAKILAQDEGRENAKKNEQPSPISKASLNVGVEAPGKIFIRGRGVNAEAGGSLNIGGKLDDVKTVGAFSLVRGRIDILSKRLTLSRGNVTFSGSLVPTLDFAATTTSGSTEVTVLVSGPADMPVIDFTSVPSLPKDEVLAQLLFGESVNDLSPIQLASLASAIATLTGGTGVEGPLGTLRNLLGVSDIDIKFDAAGNPELAVGGYISERIYLGVTQEPTTGDNAATVDIDVTKFLKLRGEAGSDGDAKAGFYYEREYD